MAELPAFTEEEVASHNTAESLWVHIEGKVYDLTPFQDSVRKRCATHCNQCCEGMRVCTVSVASWRWCCAPGQCRCVSDRWHLGAVEKGRVFDLWEGLVLS